MLHKLWCLDSICIQINRKRSQNKIWEKWLSLLIFQTILVKIDEKTIIASRRHPLPPYQCCRFANFTLRDLLPRCKEVFQHWCRGVGVPDNHFDFSHLYLSRIVQKNKKIEHRFSYKSIIFKFFNNVMKNTWNGANSKTIGLKVWTISKCH